jgi:hypothetical protein
MEVVVGYVGMALVVVWIGVAEHRRIWGGGDWWR